MSYLGRFQVGDFLPLALTTTNGSGVAVAPDACPTAKIYSNTPTLLDTVSLPVCEKAANSTRYFQFPFRLDGDYATPGSFFVVYEWAVSATTYKQVECFEVVGGGDASGATISVAEFATPAARNLMMQRDGGSLVSGQSPR